MSRVPEIEHPIIDSLYVVFMESVVDPDRNRLIIERNRHTQPNEIILVIKGERARQLYNELLGMEGGDANARAGLQRSIFSRILQDL